MPWKMTTIMTAGVASALAFSNISQKREIQHLESENSWFHLEAEKMKERLAEADERVRAAEARRAEVYFPLRESVLAEPDERDGAVAPALRGAIEGLPE